MEGGIHKGGDCTRATNLGAWRSVLERGREQCVQPGTLGSCNASGHWEIVHMVPDRLFASLKQTSRALEGRMDGRNAFVCVHRLTHRNVGAYRHVVFFYRDIIASFRERLITKPRAKAVLDCTRVETTP